MNATCQIFDLIEKLDKDGQVRNKLATLKQQHNCAASQEEEVPAWERDLPQDGTYYRLLLNRKPFVDSGPLKVRPVLGDSETSNIDINTTDAIRNGGCAVFHGAACLHIHPPIGKRWVLSGDFIMDGWARLSENRHHNTILSYGTYRDGILLRPGTDGSLWVLNQQRNCTPFFPVNKWVYFALVRSGGTVEFWTAEHGQPRAGLRESFQIGTSVINSVSTNPILGRSAHAADEYLHGLLSDFRLYHPTSKNIDKSKVPFALS